MDKPLSVVTALLLLTILAACVYLPGVAGPWLFDDKHNIVHLPNLQPQQLATQPLWRGAMVNDHWESRSLARLSFAVTVQTCGLTTRCFKATNIALHLCNGVLVFMLALQLFMRLLPANVVHARWLAVFVAGIWLLHPIQVSTVLYAVQRMTIMATMFMLAALNIFYFWRSRYACNQALVLPLLALTLVLAGYFCKENALLAILLALILEWLLPAQGRV